MVDYLNTIDGDILLFFNSIHSPYFDNLMWIATGRWIWIPLYISILFVLLKKYGLRQTLGWLIAVAITIAIADQLCASILRPIIGRYRPANLLNPLSALVHTVNGYRGGRFGFPSCHAANTFALVALLAPVIKQRRFTMTLIAWALLNCYSRMYLGVHYPGDLIAGAIIGSAIGTGIYLLWSRIMKAKCMSFFSNISPSKECDTVINATPYTFLILFFLITVIAAWQTL